MPLKRPGPDIPSFVELRSHGAPVAPAASAPISPSTPPAQPTTTAASPSQKPRRRRQAPRDEEGARGATVTLKASVPLPAPGVSALFDQAEAVYGAKQALRIILANALRGYEAALLAGEVSGLLPEPPRRPEAIQVGRAMDAAAWAQARELLDPLRILQEGRLGRMILFQALAWQLGEDD